MDDESTHPFEIAYHRERKIRRAAEQLLEDKTRMLHQRNIELSKTNEQLIQQQASMLKQEKLATLGTLAAGVAHEINNPLAFVTSNISALEEYHRAYHDMFEFVKTLRTRMTQDKANDLNREIAKLDLEYLDQDLPQLMSETLEGLERVKKIVLSLRNFARSQDGERADSDINEGIRSTLRLVQSEIKQGIDVQLALGDVPKVNCNPSEINQVILNIVINAAHAARDRAHPYIRITTEATNKHVLVSIEDNGHGMNPHTLNNLFMPFFTTKPIGEGTGMGMAIAHKIVEDHGGELSVTSQEGVGSTFTLALPITSN
ncbi:MAG TPA: ATP-binding protein [Pseudomonadales bacterium]|nr:ATP-binding protein [Pseudomonadales bacterium]